MPPLGRDPWRHQSLRRDPLQPRQPKPQQVNHPDGDEPISIARLALSRYHACRLVSRVSIRIQWPLIDLNESVHWRPGQGFLPVARDETDGYSH